MKLLKNIIFFKLPITLGICIIFKIVFFRLDEFFDYDLVYISGIIFFIWQGNLLIDSRLNTKYDWVENPKKRLIIQSGLNTIFTLISLFIFMYTIHQLRFGDGEIINPKMAEIFKPAVFFTFAVLAIHISFQFFRALKESLIQVEKYKTQSANAQLQNLKNQISPHFLFNNLSVLTSLVYSGDKKAVNFINELSKVYRYVLENKNIELVTLDKELDFINNYIYLLNIRFEDNIIFTINIEETKKTLYLPQMCLQILIENTIQHNETSQAKTLSVNIYSSHNSLVIENNIQKRRDKIESSGTGLKNIQSRYSFFTDEKVEVLNDEKLFKVILPLLSKI
jgi:two-component system LytT family sensor kinase